MSSLLDKIDSPEDLKKLSRKELPGLAGEIRKLIQEVVANTGGHLASNLGVVELTLALHYVYDFSYDRLLWDVGHQCYTHKLLTGRKGGFHTLRQYQGLSGFPNPKESPHDPLIAGHSGTSISTALGLLCAGELGHRHGGKRPPRIVALIGDGSIGSGMAFEALNHVGELKKKLLVVLNDNRMSISQTVGALSRYLHRIRVAPVYTELKKDVKQFLDVLPGVGVRMGRALEQIKNTIRHALVPGRIFEDLGFRYYGPINGHDLHELIDTLREIEKLELAEPVLLHVHTQKGRGFQPAVLEPGRFHSASPFRMENGKVRVEPESSDSQTYTQVFSRTIVKEATRLPQVCAITAAMPLGVGLEDFAKRFPERCFNVGICEQHAVGLAAGLAVGGMKPVVAVYSTFLQRAYDQVFHDVCLQGLGVVFAIDRAGLVGSDGPTHHGVFDIAYLRHLPGMTLLAPKDGHEFEQMLAFALDLDRPVAMRYPRARAPEAITGECAPIALGKAETVLPGEDGAVIAYGAMVEPCLEACRKLRQRGSSISLINARFASPVDEQLLAEQFDRQPFVITVEDGVLAGGFGSAVLELASRLGKDSRKVKCLGIPGQFIEHGRRTKLLEILQLDCHSLARIFEQEMLRHGQEGPAPRKTVSTGLKAEG